MLKLKFQYFGHLMQRVDSLEKTDVGKDWRQEEKGTTENKMVVQHHRLNGHGFEQTQETGEDRGVWRAAVHGGHKESDMT